MQQRYGRWQPGFAPFGVRAIGWVFLSLLVCCALVDALWVSDAGSKRRQRQDLSPARDSKWKPAGHLQAGRSEHTATLLPNGRVLVAGGENKDGSLSSAEVYDPATGDWTLTGNLITARKAHTATLLSTGQVLVVGGRNAEGAINSAELYDPALGTWSATGHLQTARSSPSATLLPSGRVLVVGGAGSNGSAIKSAEAYDPATGSWISASNPDTPRAEHTAVLLPDGRVLIAGGFDGDSNALSSAEAYDPRADKWSVTGNLVSARGDHTATLLPDGEVLVAGGRDAYGSLSSAELFGPQTGRWRLTGNLATDRRSHTATLLLNGQVLVAGGTNSGRAAIRSAEAYDPATGTWSATGNLNAARSTHTATLLPNNRILAVGSEISREASAGSAEAFDAGWDSDPARKPALQSVTSPLRLGTQLTASGRGFQGGNPVVQLLSLGNEQSRIFSPDPDLDWSATTFTSVPINDFPPGYALATVFANSLPSNSRIILVKSDSGLAENAQPGEADLEITMTNGVTSVNAGGTTGYTIVVANLGPSAPSRAIFTDPAVTGLSVTGVSCGSPSGGATCPGSSTVAAMQGTGIVIPTLPSGGSLTFTVTANVTAASGNITNTAAISLPPYETGTIDPELSNNLASDTDTVTPAQVADLSITKTDGVTSVNAGGTTAYTIEVKNSGPSAANQAVFTDPAVTGLSATGVSCGSASGGATCPGSSTVAAMQGAGIVIPTLPSGGSLTFTVTANVTATSGSVTNTATITPPSGVTDRIPGNNSFSDTNTINPINPVADLAITKTDGVTSVNTGDTINYTIVVSNKGPAAANGAIFTDPAAPGLSVTGVTCGAASGGGACPATVSVTAMQGAGIVIPTLPAGGAVTFAVTARVTATFCNVTNTARIAPPSGVGDNDSSNNSASDTDAVNITCPITGPEAACANTQNNLYSGPDGAGLSYLWSVSGAGTIAGAADGRTVRVNAGASGQFTLALKVTDANGCICVSTKQATVNPLPAADAGPDQALCVTSGGTAIFPLNGTVTNGTPSWSIVGSTGTITPGDVVIVNPGSAATEVNVKGTGTVTLRLTVVSNTTPGCGTAMDDVVLTVNPNPTASAGPDQALCEAASGPTVFSLSGSATNAGNPMWTILPGGPAATITNSNSLTPTVSVSGIGSVTVRLTVTSNATPACGTATDDVVLTVNQNPKANAGADRTQCATSVPFTFALSDAISTVPAGGSRNWSVVSGAATISDASAEKPNVTMNAVGSVTLRLTVTSPSCGTVSDDVTLTLGQQPQANAGTDKAICATSAPYTFTLPDAVSTVPSGGSRSWSVVSGPATISDPGAANPNVTLSAFGSAVIRLTVASPACGTVTDDVTLTLNQQPAANAGPDQASCPGANNQTRFTLGGSAPNGGAPSWSVVSGTAMIENGNTLTPTVTVSGVGSATIRLSVSSASGCPTATDEVVLTVNQTPTANAGADKTLCATNVTATFALADAASTVPAGGTRTWTVASGNASISNPNAPNPNVTLNSFGSATIRLTVTSPTCGTATDDVVLTLNQSPQANAGADQTICASSAPQMFTLAGATSTVPVGGSITWSVLSGSATIDNPNSANPRVTLSNFGPATLRLTVTSPNCGTATDDVTLTLNQQPTANAGPDQAVCQAASNQTMFILSGSAPSGGAPSWSVVSGAAAISNGNTLTPTVTVTGVGSAVIRLTVSGCATASDDVALTVNPNPTANAGPDQATCQAASGPTSFAITGGVANGAPSWSYVSSTGALTQADVTIVSPNSASTNVNVAPGKSGTVTLRLTATSTTQPGCGVRTDDVTLAINALPACGISGPTPVSRPTSECPSLAYDYNAPAGAGLSYVWQVSGGEIIGSASGQSVRVRPGASNSFELMLRTKNTITGCESETVCTRKVLVTPIDVDFGTVAAARGLGQGRNPSRKILEIENPSSVKLNSLLRTSGLVKDGVTVITDPNDYRESNNQSEPAFAPRPFYVTEENKTEPIKINGEINAASGQQLQLIFDPLIPARAGKTTGLSAFQVMPDLIESRLVITPAGGCRLTINVTARIDPQVMLIDPINPAKDPEVKLECAGDEFTVEFSVYDPNLDISGATFEFLDANGAVVGRAAIGAELLNAALQRGINKGQSFTIRQRFLGASQFPEVRSVNVIVFDDDNRSSAAHQSKPVTCPTGSFNSIQPLRPEEAVLEMPAIKLSSERATPPGDKAATRVEGRRSNQP